MIPTLRLKGKVTKLTGQNTGYIKDENGNTFFFHHGYTIPRPGWFPIVGQVVEFSPLPKAKDKQNPVAFCVLAL